MMSKEDKYKEVLQNIELLIKNEKDLISVMSTISCEIFHAFEYLNWVGFYRLVDETTLKVGPYQGTHGCLTINIKNGVCGKSAREKKVQIENDVSKIPFHIACSSETNSEIVVPVLDKDGNLKAVFDVDSLELNSFDKIDEKYLKMICEKVYRET